MLMVIFYLGDDRYALDSGQVEAVVPQTRRRSLPKAPPCVAGVFDYHGTPVPVIDMCQLILARPCKNHYSTRMILVHYDDQPGQPRLIALLAERVTETIDGDEKDFVACVRVDGLLTDEVRAILFNGDLPASGAGGLR